MIFAPKMIGLILYFSRAHLTCMEKYESINMIPKKLHKLIPYSTFTAARRTGIDGEFGRGVILA